ncbi:MAG: hypothetical protein O2856_09135, partial [Planctomycetota bacterium]|nr:hypothetical protein [Planctomycetota bacterium]
MKFWPILKWMIFLSVATVVAIGAGGAWLWTNSDRLIRDLVFQTFDKVAPDLELRIDGIQLTSPSSLRLTGIELRERAANRVVLRAREAVATVDETQLIEKQNIIVRSIRISGSDVLLQRSENGRWNWQDYAFRPISDNPLIPPSVILENVRAQIQLDHGDGIPPANLLVTSPSFQAVPKSADAYDFLGTLALPGAGNLAVTGAWNLASKDWSLSGSLNGMTADRSLMELAKSTSPQLAEQLQQLDAKIVSVLPSPGGNRTVSADTETSAVVVGRSSVAPRFMGVLDVDFLIEKRSKELIPNLRLKVEVRDGQLSSPVVPVRLSDVRARFFWDNDTVDFRLLNARDGDALVTGQFSLDLRNNAPPATATVHLEKFPITEQLKPLFPERTQKLFDNFEPSGTVSGDIAAQQLPSGKWLPTSIDGVAEGASVRFHKFRYPVTGIGATLHQRPLPSNADSMDDVICDIVADGMLGNRPVTSFGWIRNPSPELELDYHLEVQDLPLDGKFRDALDSNGRKIVESLNIEGLASARIDCRRSPGLDQPTDIVILGTVHDGTVQFSKFPYPVNDFSGQLTFDSKSKSWRFIDLQGRHDAGVLTAHGSFRGLPEPGVLDLTISAKNASFDAELFHALNPSSRTLWTMLQPQGSVDLTTKIDWTAAPGQVPIVKLQNVRIFDAVINPSPFPYRMNIREARLRYTPNDPENAGVHYCSIETLQGDHEGSAIQAKDCWAALSPDGYWQLHLNHLNAADLKPDDALRAALPANWRDTLSRLSRNGRISIESSELDFRGVTDGTAPTTAAWSLSMRLKQCEVSAGLDLTKVSGMVAAFGTWDGYHLKNEGEIRLDEAEVLEMSITDIHGPYAMSEDELVLGCREIIRRQVQPADVAKDRRIMAKAYRGVLEMDGMIDLTKGSEYEFFGELKTASLENYAARHMPDQRNMKGVVNAWLFVNGDGDSAANLKGSGQMLIYPAALYEVPVVLEMLNALSTLQFAVPNRAAFDYALMSFKIKDEAFDFERIDLSGNTLALRGRGEVGF